MCNCTLLNRKDALLCHPRSSCTHGSNKLTTSHRRSSAECCSTHSCHGSRCLPVRLRGLRPTPLRRVLLFDRMPSEPPFWKAMSQHLLTHCSWSGQIDSILAMLTRHHHSHIVNSSPSFAAQHCASLPCWYNFVHKRWQRGRFLHWRRLCTAGVCRGAIHHADSSSMKSGATLKTQVHWPRPARHIYRNVVCVETQLRT